MPKIIEMWPKNQEKEDFEYITENQYQYLKEDADSFLSNRVYDLVSYNKRLKYLDYCLEKSKERDAKK